MFAYLQNRPTVCSLPTPFYALPLFTELQVHVYICVRHQQNISPPPPLSFELRERRGNISFASGLGYIYWMTSFPVQYGKTVIIFFVEVLLAFTNKELNFNYN